MNWGEEKIVSQLKAEIKELEQVIDPIPLHKQELHNERISSIRSPNSKWKRTC